MSLQLNDLVILVNEKNNINRKRRRFNELRREHRCASHIRSYFYKASKPRYKAFPLEEVEEKLFQTKQEGKSLMKTKIKPLAKQLGIKFKWSDGGNIDRIILPDNTVLEPKKALETALIEKYLLYNKEV